MHLGVAAVGSAINKTADEALNDGGIVKEDGASNFERLDR